MYCLTDKEKILGMIGLVARAGKIVSGMDAVVEDIKKHKIKLVIIAKDISDKSKENVQYVCTNNGIKTIEFSTMEELGNCIGKKNRAIIGIKDESFSKRNN